MVKGKNQYTVQWIEGSGKTHAITAYEGENLLDICREHGILAEAACNGNGTCGKCRVQLLKGDSQVTGKQRDVFTPTELAMGYRLACQVKVTQDLSVRSLGQAMHIQMPFLEAGSALPGGLQKNAQEAGSRLGGAGYGIAADLGSTTLAAAFIDAGGTVLAQATAVNSQRSYGADVISRIQASNGGKQEALRACICRDLEQLFRTLAGQAGIEREVSCIAIAGNTTMLHLLRGYSCERLGQAPFEPVSLWEECLDFEELFAQPAGCREAKVYLLPGMSAFVGADITAGLYSSGFWQEPADGVSFFIDLGTNGELAFGNREGFVTASAPAGPAFEGGRLSCGMPGTYGAISNVSFLYHRPRVQTIGQKKPCGICGSGALGAVAALLAEGLMDTAGLLAPQLFETGLALARREDGSKISLTQADVREIQMAKAAVRAGIEVLYERYKEAFPDSASLPLRHVYLAGGFGYYLPEDTAIATGLFPPGWKGKIIQCGNTSLKGAIAFLADASCSQTFADICARSRCVRLEEDVLFQNSYVQYMDFEAEA